MNMVLFKNQKWILNETSDRQEIFNSNSVNISANQFSIIITFYKNQEKIVYKDEVHGQNFKEQILHP